MDKVHFPGGKIAREDVRSVKGKLEFPNFHPLFFNRLGCSLAPGLRLLADSGGIKGETGVGSMWGSEEGPEGPINEGPIRRLALV